MSQNSVMGVLGILIGLGMIIKLSFQGWNAFKKATSIRQRIIDISGYGLLSLMAIFIIVLSINLTLSRPEGDRYSEMTKEVEKMRQSHK